MQGSAMSTPQPPSPSSPPPDADTVARILAGAAERVSAPAGEARPYAGAVTPAEAWQLCGLPNVHFVDVRSPEEYRYVGHVPGSKLIVWRGTTDDQVAQFLRELREQVAPDDVVLLLCRSSVRSVRAATAMARQGYSRAYNILEGFEGKPDARQQRGHIDGWRKAGLPWQQE